MRIVFLYSELANYTIACLKELSNYVGQISVIRYPVNSEAPFQFDYPENIDFIDRKTLSLKQLKTKIDRIDPSIIICSGWIDKDYLKICKTYKKSIPTVLAFDTHWTGSLKQKIATFLSPFFLKNTFSHAWVPGDIQKKYALKLGFKNEKIYTGFYCADSDKFNSFYSQFKEEKEKKFPKRFIYVGRYYDFKGIKDLWQAFIELQQEQANEWELWCLGTGDIKPIEHQKIKHFGFIQPNEMADFIKNTGVFVLPSHFEPWAVVVHEFACAGFPMICSSAVGAADQFVISGENGYIYESGNVNALKERLKAIINLPTESLNLMGEKSVELSKSITLKGWSETTLKILKDK